MKIIRQTTLIGLVLFAALVLTSCGGKWDENAKNWGRAFKGQIQPADVKVIHSRYYRSPHFTYEAYYYFQITAPDQFLDAWVKFQKLTPTTPTSDNLGLNLQSYADKPNWFLPNLIGNYEMWIPSDNKNSNFRLFRDRLTKDIFVTDSE